MAAVAAARDGSFFAVGEVARRHSVPRHGTDEWKVMRESKYARAIMRVKWRAAIAALGVAAAALIVQRVDTQQSPASAPRYADPAACEACDAEIANTFHKTGMGRSFYRWQPGNAVEDFAPGKAYFHEASKTYIAMVERGGKCGNSAALKWKRGRWRMRKPHYAA
jgi:hypothetical protein